MNKVVISVVTILVLQFISITAAVPCDPKCAGGWGYGVCKSNGRCRCWWGWSGPNAVYITSGGYKNRILADFCTTACHYTHVYRSPLCARIPTPPTTTQPTTTAKPSTPPPTTESPSTTGIIQTTGIPTTAVPCDPKCKGGQGVCQSDGRCFCWWGWTGPHAVYIMTGADKNRIEADYCTTACHYTHDYLNPACASFPTPSVCSVPVYPIVPPIPCDPLCGTGSYYGRGTCKSNGRCLCWWGWTGPNACYVDGGTYNNRILADRCVDACHYTHDYRNYNCINGSSTTKLSTQPPTTGNPGTGSRTTAAPAVPCDPRCKGFHTGGNCSTADGRCYCFWGWTGPNAEYITVTGPEKNRIKADYCTTACHYTHDYLNPACASIPTPQVCSVPVHPIVPPIPCDPLCGTGKYYGKGNCTSNGRCLCWWGWTGPNACYVDGGTYNNRILADRCVDACHYTHDHRNYNCTNGSSTAKPPTTGNPGTGTRTSGIIPTTAAPAVPCDPKCKGFHTGGNCSTADGRCYCFWGWTGPHAVYITVTGPEKNRIKADYCTTACHYTHDYLNPACASIPFPQVCSVPVHPIVPPIPCDPLCGTGKYYGKGNCTSNGRCLCWWGWTGPNACYVDGGTYNNRIIADRCVDACHYTHDHRNYNCTNGSSTAKPPSTQPLTTGNPGTGSRTTGKPTTGLPTTGLPTTGKSYQSSTNQQTTKTTTSPKTSSATTKQSTTSDQTTSTVAPATKQKTTTQGAASTTAKPTTQAAATTAKATTVQPTTKQKTTTQLASTTAKPTTLAATTAGKTTTVQPTTKQKTTSQGVASTTAKPTTQAATTAVKTTTVGTTPTTKQKTTTQVVTTTAQATTTQAPTTTEPPEPTEPTEPPEPTEPTEPGVLQVRGMLPDQLQNNVDDSEVDDVKDDEEEEYKEPKNSSAIALVIVLIVLLVCVMAFGGAVWWTYGHGNQCPSILRGYEPVSESDTNNLMNEFPMSTHVP